MAHRYPDSRKILWILRFSVLVSCNVWAWPALAAFCTGKQNGLWCEGSTLVTCKSGTAAASQNCPAGCVAMPPGVPDKCANPSGPCAGKPNGAWCDGGNLLMCSNGAIASSKPCSYGCQSMPAGTADVCKSAPVASGPCTGKANGAWCDGDKLLQCQSGQVASSQTCSLGCEQKPPGVSDICKTAAAPPSPCSTKVDGKWCEGDKLLHCQAGQNTSSQLCAYGCQSMPPGVADQCKAAPTATGPCAGKGDGAFCEGSQLLQCKSAKVAATENCQYGCQQQPAGVADQCKPAPMASGPCSGKADGPWCQDQLLTVCKGGQVVGTKICADGCLEQSAGAPDACAPPPFDPTKACSGKPDGAWCNGSKLLTCKAGAVAGAFTCPGGCLQMPPGVADACKSTGDGPCSGKADGTWCGGNDLVQCVGGQVGKAVACAKGCAQPAPASASCKVKGAGFCSGKANGGWCDGPLLTECSGGAPKSSFACPGNCTAMPPGQPDTCQPAKPDKGTPPKAPSGTLKVTSQSGCGTFEGSLDVWGGKGLKVWNQKDFPEQLGTCPGLTIHNSGCTITALSMMHQLLGVEREVDGKTGSDPVTENAWRKQFNGYAGTSYEVAGKKVSGKCLVLWGQAPGGLVPAHSYNAKADCLSDSAATFIASALKAGMPVVAGVHWAGGNASFYGSKEDWHWVLIVGADDNGVLINDPWGGLERVRLSKGGLGSYVLDDLYVFWQAGIQPGGLAPAPLDDQGEPTTEELLPKTLTYAEDPVAPANPADTADAGSGDAETAQSDGGKAAAPGSAAKAKDEGCAAVPTATDSGWAGLLLCGAALLLRMRRRRLS